MYSAMVLWSNSQLDLVFTMKITYLPLLLFKISAPLGVTKPVKPSFLDESDKPDERVKYQMSKFVKRPCGAVRSSISNSGESVSESRVRKSFGPIFRPR